MDSIGFLPELSCSFAGMNGLYELKIADVRRETAGCVSVAFDIPENPNPILDMLRVNTNRRQTSMGSRATQLFLCSAPSDGEWRVAM